MKILHPKTRRGKILLISSSILLLLLSSGAIYYTVTLFTKAQSCFTIAQIQADSKCLYIYKTSVYEKGTRAQPHHDNPCGTDVTSKLPDSHLLDKVGHLDPNYQGELCAGGGVQPTAIPTQAPTATIAPTTIAPTATNTPVPTATSIPPTSTSTPVPATPTSAPSPTPVPPTSTPIIAQLPQTNGGITQVPTIPVPNQPSPTTIVPSINTRGPSPTPTALPVAGDTKTVVSAGAISFLLLFIGAVAFIL